VDSPEYTTLAVGTPRVEATAADNTCLPVASSVVTEAEKLVSCTSDWKRMPATSGCSWSVGVTVGACEGAAEGVCVGFGWGGLVWPGTVGGWVTGARVGRRLGEDDGDAVGELDEGVDGTLDVIAVGGMGLDEDKLGDREEGVNDWDAVGEAVGDRECGGEDARDGGAEGAAV